MLEWGGREEGKVEDWQVRKPGSSGSIGQRLREDEGLGEVAGPAARAEAPGYPVP